MSQKQLNRYAVISKVIEGTLTISQAAAHLGISNRQTIRIKKKFIEEGPGSLIHKNANRKPLHALPQEIIDKILKLRRTEPFQSANFLHFQELLEQHAAISISYSCLHSLLTQNGIVSPKKRRRLKLHRRRCRKPQEGLLLQMDATPFEWFGTPEKFALHGAIDDATGKIVGLFLTKNECLHGYWQTIRQVLLQHGIPTAIYTDRHSIFLSQNASKLTLEEQLSGKVVNETQFGRAMSELGISLLRARSPQAKGRIERLWQTLQSRLPVEFKLAGITTVEQANAFLGTYMQRFNTRFAVEPSEALSAFRTVPHSLNVDEILCVKLFRSTDSGGVFSFCNRQFKVVANDAASILPAKAKVLVLVSAAFGIKVQYKNVVFPVLPYVSGKKLIPEKTLGQKAKTIPSVDHPWHGLQALKPSISYEDNNQLILSMLESIFLSKYA